MCSNKYHYQDLKDMSLTEIHTSIPFIIGYSLLGLFFVIQLFYYLYFYNRISITPNKKEETKSYPALSIIICVENQIDFLRQNIDSILSQDYPSFEVIVVDIASDDGTKDYLEYLENNHPNFYFSYTPESARFISRKKLAQTIGIKASKHDWLVFTEIDGKPVSNQWLKKLASHFNDKETDIVLGYSKYTKEKSWINRYSSYDNQLLGMRYLSFALAGKPYMGLGKNMAYRKEIFYNDKAFSNQLNLQRGEDDLFINQNATNKNTKVEISPESVIEMDPLSKHKDWKLSKRYHLLSMQRYKGYKHYIVGFDTTSRLLFYALNLFLFSSSLITAQWIIAVVLFLLFITHWVIRFYITNKAGKALKEERRYYFSLFLLDFIIPLKVLFIKFKMPKRGRGDIIKL